MEKVYAGWLGKVIGVRYGAPIEMWSDERIASFFGELKGYVTHYEDFAADDDTNGPLFFVRALEDYHTGEQLTAAEIGKTVLNYVPYEHGFFWWGGYGISAEHTMYHNLRSGILPPQSGSALQNGSIMAEQIGGQIFIDCWGLVCPGDYQKAAEYAQKAASIAWDGEGIYGGMFIAACISAAFDTQTIREIIEKALSVIPAKCVYAKMVRDIMQWHAEHTDDWRSCLAYIKQEYWMDRYIGNCHIVPNAAIIILSMLYGQGDFSKSLHICNMCGFDTDCNVGNLGTILGVFNGLDQMDLAKWAPEIHDFQAASSVIGSLNITDVASSALYFAHLGYRVMNEPMPDEWKRLVSHQNRICHFELPYSTHSLRAEALHHKEALVHMQNVDEDACSGKRCLKVAATPFSSGSTLKIYLKTYYEKSDFANGRYEPVCSPIAYPGQTMTVAIKPIKDQQLAACLFAHDKNTDELLCSEYVPLSDSWHTLSFTIPAGTDACIDQIGVLVKTRQILKLGGDAQLYIDDFSWDGMADYCINFSNEHNWTWLMRDARTELSQFTRLKGIWHIINGALHAHTNNFADVYSGDWEWKDYTVESTITPKSGSWHGIRFRVQGAMRSYAAVLTNKGLELFKQVDGQHIPMAAFPCCWEHDHTYPIKASVCENHIKLYLNNQLAADVFDTQAPYLHGCIGASVDHGSSCVFGNFSIKPYKEE